VTCGSCGSCTNDEMPVSTIVGAAGSSSEATADDAGCSLLLAAFAIAPPLAGSLLAAADGGTYSVSAVELTAADLAFASSFASSLRTIKALTRRCLVLI
jgi:hypothetical protein